MGMRGPAECRAQRDAANAAARELRTIMRDESAPFEKREAAADRLLPYFHPGLAAIEARTGGQTHEDQLEELRRLAEDDRAGCCPWCQLGHRVLVCALPSSGRPSDVRVALLLCRQNAGHQNPKHLKQIARDTSSAE